MVSDWFYYFLGFRFLGKVVFCAHTKPLARQQIDSISSYVPFRDDDMILLTGDTPPSKRESLWKEKRIFILTPQIVENDIKSGICPAEDIVLAVIDEAHKARGKNSYCNLIQKIAQSTKYFRVVALTGKLD